VCLFLIVRLAANKQHPNMNIFEILLTLIELRLSSPALHRVIESLGKSVDECYGAIDKATKSQNSDYFEDVVNDECAVTENLLGAAFVTCQAEITAVTSHIKRIHAEASARGVNLVSSDGKKDGILSIGNSTVRGSTYTQVQVINAFANYFKHCEEWGQPWQGLTGNSKQTADIILQMGADEFGTGNLRAGIEALGISDCRHLEPLAEYVSNWINVVRKTYETELRQHNLL
jgi:hypothetical protein